MPVSPRQWNCKTSAASAVFKMRNIGDVLMITPVLRALRETFPEARITAVVNSGTEAMLANNPHIDEVLVYQRARAVCSERAPISSANCGSAAST